MPKQQINQMISMLDKVEQKTASAITYDIIDLATKVCERFNTVIEGFFMGHNVCYFAFNVKDYANDIYNKVMPKCGTNSIEDTEDWEYIEMFGIDTDKNFQKLVKLYNQYADRFNLYNMNIGIIFNGNKYELTSE